MLNDPQIEPEIYPGARHVWRSAARLAWHLLWRSAQLHVQRRLAWPDFPRSKTLARIGMALLGTVVGVACLHLGLGVLPAVTLATVSLVGMEQAMRIVGDPRWMVAYAGAGLTGILLGFAAGLISPLLGSLVGYIALVTAVRLGIAAMPLAR